MCLTWSRSLRGHVKARSYKWGHYAAKFGENTEIDLTCKWSHELSVKNRMKGNALVFQLSGQF